MTACCSVYDNSISRCVVILGTSAPIYVAGLLSRVSRKSAGKVSDGCVLSGSLSRGVFLILFKRVPHGNRMLEEFLAVAEWLQRIAGIGDRLPLPGSTTVPGQPEVVCGCQTA